MDPQKKHRPGTISKNIPWWAKLVSRHQVACLSHRAMAKQAPCGIRFATVQSDLHTSEYEKEFPQMG